MDMTGEHRIEAPRERVWAALNDPEILRQCIPGCEEVEKLSDTEFTAKVVAKVGPVKAKFTGSVTLGDIDAPNSCRITGEGSGGVAGFAKGSADVRLSDADGATVLAYTARASVGGKLAQIGSRLIDATARKMADDFFARFSEIVGGTAPREEAPATAAASDIVLPSSTVPGGLDEAAVLASVAAAETPSDTQPSGGAATRHEAEGLRPAVWIPLVIGTVILLLWAFT